MPCPPLAANFSYRLQPGPNQRVTSSTASQSRSESVVGVNPTNGANIICASKKFINPQQYTFTISTSFSVDSGLSWTESPLTLQPGWQGMTDPDLTFDALGNAYLIIEANTFPGGGVVDTIGMFVYKSVDGGKSWKTPVLLHNSPANQQLADDKQWIDADVSPSSPHYGSVYAVWGASTNLRFSRSDGSGSDVEGRGRNAVGQRRFSGIGICAFAVRRHGWSDSYQLAYARQ